jgi:hypothetical protein
MKTQKKCSVADPGCLSRILIFTHPGSPIPDPKTATKERGEKNFCHTFSHKFQKIENYFSFEVLKKKIWANFQRITELFTQKIVTELSKIWLWDPENTYYRSRIQGSRFEREGSGHALACHE